MPDTLSRIKDLRQGTGKAFIKAYQKLQGTPDFTESNLRDCWLSELGHNPQLRETGWYTPPPGGIICTSCKAEDDYAALRQASFREESTWPQNTPIGEEDILFAYASPVDRQTGYIGDWGLCLYRGSNPGIIEHLENALLATIDVAQAACSGMAMKDLYHVAINAGTIRGLSSSNVQSQSDSSGYNIGHTIPLHVQDISRQSSEECAKSISDNRTFINSGQAQTIGDNMALVIEPRYSTKSYPDTLFHMTVIFEDGQKDIVHNYSEILALNGMDRLIRHLP